MILFSEDCLACLCGLPHSFEEHQKAVEQAANELHYELELLQEDIKRQDFDLEEEEKPLHPLGKTALPEPRERQTYQLPITLDELRTQFDVELVTFHENAPCEVYIFAFSRDKWKRAREAAIDLLQKNIISPESFVELQENGFFGSFVGNLDTVFQGIAVESFRDRAYRKQNSIK